MAYQRCPKCDAIGSTKLKRKPRQRDGYICTYDICYNPGCGYSKLLKATPPRTGIC